MKIIPNEELNAVSQAVQNAFPPYLELDNTSLSKTPVEEKGSDFESLLPVQLPEEWEKDYNTVLFTRKNLTAIRRSQDAKAQQKAAAGVPDAEDEDDDAVAKPAKKKVNAAAPQMMRESYTLLANYLAQQSGAINSAFAASRFLLVNSQFFATADTIEEKNRLASVFANQVDFNMSCSADPVRIDSTSLRYLDNMKHGNTHIIRDSKRYPRGYDILFTGNPGALASMELTVGLNEIETNRFKSSFAEMKAPGGHFNLPAGQAAAKYSRALITKLFGADAATPKTQSQRQIAVLPMNFSFKKMLKEIEGNLASAGVDPRAISENTIEFPQIFPQAMERFFSIVAVLDAHPVAVSEKSKGALDSSVAEESLYMQPQISFTIAINLPEPVVAFITQTKPGERVPLAPLHIWATVWANAYLRKMAMKKGERSSGGVPLDSVPKYVLSASRTKELSDKRAEKKFFTEPGRSNDDHIFISSIGTLNYCPKSENLILDNAKNYESLMEDALRVSFDAGAPLMIHQVEESNPVFGANSPEYRNKIRNYKESIKKYTGSMQAFSWDYNCVLTVAAQDKTADKLNAEPLAGSAIPDELSLTDYMRRKFCESMQLMFTQSFGADNKLVTYESFGAGARDATVMLDTQMFNDLRRFYAYLLQDKSVPDFQELVNRAAKDLEMTNLSTDENHKPYEWGYEPSGGRYLYKGFLTADLKVAADIANDVDKNMDAIFFCFRRALADSSGGSTSNLARNAYTNGFNIEEDPHYFHPGHTLAEFKNVYNYLGGRVFYHMMKAIVECDMRKFMVINVNNPRKQVNYLNIMREIMPLATMFSKYVPDSEAIYERADAIAERNQKNEGITAEDIRVPGSKAPDEGYPSVEGTKSGMQMFPHQIEGHKYLRNAPRFAVLDIAPGGGKTIEVLSDIACLVRDKLIEHPLIACPTGLMRNWVEDLHKITQGKWNVIPINVDTLKRWSYERLTDMIKNKPRNTVCVVGYSALSRSNTFNIIIGNHVEKVSGVLEFVKKFGFDYVALDESHRVKNPSSLTHQTIKQLCTSSAVKYVRLATGTLISNKLTDVVGQAAMFNAQIFRTPEEYEAENTEMILQDGKWASVWKSDTPQLARKQLARHSAVITFKRKEWAFMLPMPQEEFIPVDMDADGPEGQAHQMMYEAVLNDTIKVIEAEMNKDGSPLAALMKGGSEDDDSPSDDKNKKDQDPTTAEKIGAVVDSMFDKDGSVKNAGMDDTTLEELSAALGPYLQRLEMLLTDPLGDEFGEKFIGNINPNYVSKKVRTVIERIRLNFDLKPWAPGSYKKSDPNSPEDDDLVMPDVCDYNGSRYVLMPAKGSEGDPNAYYAPYMSTIPPDQDPDRWKPEKYGKVIVFCRYTRSVNAIFDALQKSAPELAKAAVRFHGEEKNKKSNLDRFMSTKIDPTCKSGVQILIANEQAISEGYNLQMASRLIRVEAPWAPGELDQAAARIFRPDPKKEFSREHIYLDWILTDRTLEVSKMARLISKMVTKTQFDEAHNSHYDSLKSIRLEMKSMGIDALKDRSRLRDIEPYTSAYARMAQLTGREFKHMRETKANTMFDIEPEPMFDDAKIIPYVPYLPNMAIPDREGLGLTVLTVYLQNADNPDAKAILADPKKEMVGRYVHTEFGNGVVEAVRLHGGKISTITVVLDGTDERITPDPSLVYVSPNLTREVIKKLPKAQRLNEKQKKELEKQRIADQKKADREEKQKKAQEGRLIRGIGRLKANRDLGKPAAAKKDAVPTPTPKVSKKKDAPQVNNNLELYPSVINGFLALDATTEDTDIDLTYAGFVKIDPYVYFKILNRGDFVAVTDWIESKFYVKKATWNRIINLLNSFEGTGKRAKFDVEQAPLSEFKNFFAMYKGGKHTMAMTKEETPNGKPELKLYPMYMNGSLYLTADHATNPVIRRYIGKAIPDVQKEKFHIGGASNSKGEMWYRFAKSNSVKDLKSMVDELVAAGFVWTNKADYDAEIKNLKANHGVKR